MNSNANDIATSVFAAAVIGLIVYTATLLVTDALTPRIDMTVCTCTRDTNCPFHGNPQYYKDQSHAQE